MFCPNCGKDVPENQVCICQQTAQQPQTQQAPPPYQAGPAPATDNRKTYCILAYIGILWLIGLCSQEKNDPKVKFHVGQGIILSIVSVGLGIVLSIINAILLAVMIGGNYGGFNALHSNWGMYSIISGLLSFAVAAVVVILLIIGIMNVNKGEEKPLPIIGQFAFYK